jgi:sugar phosphate isomerase/epimerase
VSAGKAKGTRHESNIVAFLRANGFPWADRVPLSGARDRGDVTIGPGSPVIEAKNQQRYSWAEWLDEALAEAANADAPFGVVWAHRRGRSNAGDGYVVMDGRTFVHLLREAGF